MLLRIFRVNDPYRLLGIFILLIVMSLALFVDPVGITLTELRSAVLGESLNTGKSLYSQLLTNMPPLAAWVFGWIDLLFGRSLTARHVLSVLIIFFQGAFFAVLLINNKAQNESTYLPALIFGVLCFISFDMISLSAELLGSVFLLGALNNLFKEVEFRIQQDSILLNLGLWLGIASLLVFSYAVFLPGTLIILLIFTRLTIRKALLLIFGFLLPHALLGITYFFRGNFNALWNNFYKGSEWMGSNLISLSSMILLSVIPIAYFVFSLIMVNREARLTKYQSQLLQIMFIWLLIAVAELILAGRMSPSRVITFAPPLAYFTSHYFLLMRRKWVGEIMIWVFIGGIILTSYLARYQKTEVIDYKNMFPGKSMFANQIKDKRVLVLGTDWGLFETNQQASYFFDWKMAEPVFSEPEYFENVVLVDQSFMQDAPEIIVDTNNLMSKMMDRIPRLQQAYKKQGDLYIRNRAY